MSHLKVWDCSLRWLIAGGLPANFGFTVSDLSSKENDLPSRPAQIRQADGFPRKTLSKWWVFHMCGWLEGHWRMPEGCWSNIANRKCLKCWQDWLFWPGNINISIFIVFVIIVFYFYNDACSDCYYLSWLFLWWSLKINMISWTRSIFLIVLRLSWFIIMIVLNCPVPPFIIKV